MASSPRKKNPVVSLGNFARDRRRTKKLPDLAVNSKLVAIRDDLWLLLRWEVIENLS
jgi:hypothetical protein